MSSAHAQIFLVAFPRICVSDGNGILLQRKLGRRGKRYSGQNGPQGNALVMDEIFNRHIYFFTECTHKIKVNKSDVTSTPVIKNFLTKGYFLCSKRTSYRSHIYSILPAIGDIRCSKGLHNRFVVVHLCKDTGIVVYIGTNF